MAIVRLHSRPLDAPDRRSRPAPGVAVQVIAVVGAFVVGVVLALMLPGTARGADPLPVAVGDQYEAPHAGTFVVVARDGVLANDTGDGLTAELWTDADHGVVTLAPDGSFTYEPTGAADSDAFAYLATDVTGLAAEPVRVHLRILNASPRCDALQLVDLPQGEPVEVDLRETCRDADGDPLTFEYQRPDLPPGSAWESTPQGIVRFLPPGDWAGTGAVMFTASDGRDTSMPELLTIGVIPD